MEHSNESMTTNNYSNRNLRTANDDFDLREVVRVVWKGKLMIIVITLMFIVSSVIYALRLPNIYKSEVLLAPVEQEGTGGLASLAGQFGGLASLAGVNLGGENIKKTELALEVLNSRQFTSAFIAKHEILPDLMAALSWDMQANELVYDELIYDDQNKRWLREVTTPFKPQPSLQEAYKVFKNVVSTSMDKNTGMVTISVEHLSPYVAKQWVSWLVEDINLVMKEMEVKEAKRSTSFLKRQIEQTEVADIRQILYRLIEEQTKTMMFAKIRDEYVFKTIDAALVPEVKSKPKRALIVVLGTLIGGMLSVIIVLTRHFISSGRP